MTKEFKIKKQDYYSRDDIQIEISEDIVVPIETKQTFVSVSNIKNTISFLKEKKRKFVAEIEEEIKQNQEILDSMKTEIEKVELKEKLEINNNL